MLEELLSAFAFTFEVDEESTLSETGRIDDEPDVGDAGVDLNCVSPEGAAVAEVRGRRMRRLRRGSEPRRHGWSAFEKTCATAQKREKEYKLVFL